MSVAIRTITRLQDADDVNVSLDAGEDGKALVYDHDTARFVLDTVAGAGGGDFSTVVDAAGGGDYTTLSAALAAASAGDAIFIKNGTYAGGITISLDGVTIRGESRDGVVIQSPSNSVTPAISVSGNKVTIDTIKIDGRRDLQTDAGTGDVGQQDYSGIYVTGDDVTIRNAWVFETRGMGICGISGADRGTIIYCRIENRATNGAVAVAGAYSGGVFVIGTATRWYVLNSLVTGWAQGVGLWYGANECIVAFNRIINNYGYGDTAHTITRSAIEDYGATAATHGRNVWAYNVIDGSTSCCIECAQGVDGSQYVGNILRNYNKFGDNTGGPFVVADGGAGERTLNISLVNNQIYGHDVAGMCGTRGANILIDSNLFQDLNNIALASGVVTADDAISTGLRITRNVFKNCRSGITLINGIADGAVVSQNVIDSPSVSTSRQIAVDGGAAHVIDSNYINVNGVNVIGVQIAATAGNGHRITNNTCIGFTSWCIDVLRGNCQVLHNYLVTTNAFGAIQLYGATAIYNNVRWNYCNANNAARTIFIDSGAASNIIQENHLIGGTAAGVYSGTSSSYWPTENGNVSTPNHRHTTMVPMAGLALGAKTVGASQSTIAHGLPWTPREVRVVMTSTGSIWRSAASDATNIYLTADDANRTCEVWVV